MNDPIVLAVDTTTSSCGVSLTGENGTIAEITRDDKETHSKHLLAMIEALLETEQTELSAISCFAVTTGPGSFTGLRIGLSTVKGLSAATGVPVIGVSSLKTLAFGATDLKMPVCSVIDARRNEVYAAFYRYRDGRLRADSEEMVVAPEVLVRNLSEKTAFVGNGAGIYRDILTDIAGDICVIPEQKRVHSIQAAMAGQLALEVYKAGGYPEVGAVAPHYIRKSDAETGLEKKQKAGAT